MPKPPKAKRSLHPDRGDPPHKTPWRDNLEAGVMAILLALFLKAFLVEAYKIPSGSMQPTLMGMPSPGDVLARRAGERPLEVKDRILVDKLSYKVRDPERWEVAVFRYPLKRTQNFVKRLVGLPGDRLRILYGDLWRYDEEAEGGPAWKVLRRPDGVQSAHWRSLTTDELAVSPWRQVSGNGWLLDGRDVTVRGDGAIEFGDGGSIVDRYFDGYPDAIRERLPDRHPSKERLHAVGDIRLTGSVTASAATESVTIAFTEGQRRYSFELVGPAGEGGVSIEVDPPAAAVDDARVEAADVALLAGRSVDFSVENLDDRLTLRLDGDVVAELDVEFAVDQSARIVVEARGSDAELEDLRVWRDIFYFSDRSQEFELPEGTYFAMGDNTLDSSDSREWRRARYQVRGQGDGEPIVLEGNLRRGDNPSRATNDPGLGRIRRFTDQWGMHHLIQEDPGAMTDLPDWLTPVTELESEASPFIERRLIVGRALAVFWPIAPHKGIYRLRWVR